eukprot:152842-Hanusia_phi.AAC.1
MHCSLILLLFHDLHLVSSFSPSLSLPPLLSRNSLRSSPLDRRSGRPSARRGGAEAAGGCDAGRARLAKWSMCE